MNKMKRAALLPPLGDSSSSRSRFLLSCPDITAATKTEPKTGMVFLAQIDSGHLLKKGSPWVV